MMMVDIKGVCPTDKNLVEYNHQSTGELFLEVYVDNKGVVVNECEIDSGDVETSHRYSFDNHYHFAIWE